MYGSIAELMANQPDFNRMRIRNEESLYGGPVGVGEERLTPSMQEKLQPGLSPVEKTASDFLESYLSTRDYEEPELIAFDIPGRRRVGSIPPTSVTTGGYNLLPWSIGASKIPYAEQEYGLYNTVPLRGSDGKTYYRAVGQRESKFAPAGVTLSRGRRGNDPGPRMRPHGSEFMGTNAEKERELRTPIDEAQLQLRKTLGRFVPGMF